MKSLVFVSLLFLSVNFATAEAQKYLIVSQENGSSSTDITAISKINFLSGNMVVTKSGSAQDVYSLISIRRITFNSISALSTTQADADKIQLYPNPCTQSFQISNLNENKPLEIRIFRTDGVLIYRRMIAANEKTDVSFLERGIYLVCINGKTLKLFKQ